MSTGTTFDYVITRDEVIREALKKVGGYPPDGQVPFDKLTGAISTLNRIIRQEDRKGTGGNSNLWAISTDYLILSAGGYIYSTTEGLASNIIELQSAYFRDVSGDDSPLDVLPITEYDAKISKDDTGDPSCVYLQQSRLPGSHKLIINGAPTSVTAGDEVTGTDSLNYTCILKHTSATINKPITGASYSLYWKQTGSSGAAWVTATDYDNGELIRYTYKRPLYDFDSATDNPDMPQGWEQYLIYRLAYEMASDTDFNMTTEKIAMLRAAYREAYMDIFPSTRPQTNSFHGKSQYF